LLVSWEAPRHIGRRFPKRRSVPPAAPFLRRCGILYFYVTGLLLLRFFFIFIRKGGDYF